MLYIFEGTFFLWLIKLEVGLCWVVAHSLPVCYFFPPRWSMTIRTLVSVFSKYIVLRHINMIQYLMLYCPRMKDQEANVKKIEASWLKKAYVLKRWCHTWFGWVGLYGSAVLGAIQEVTLAKCHFISMGQCTDWFLAWKTLCLINRLNMIY